MVIVNHVPALLEKRFGARKVNLREVERETGLAYSTVSAWARGKVDRIDFPVLEKWCKYLGVGVGELLEYRADAEG